METNKKTTGQIITELRKLNNLSQEQLATSLYVTRQTISKWETDTGTPDLNNLKNIASYFGVTVDYLLGKEENDNVKPIAGNIVVPPKKTIDKNIKIFDYLQRGMLLLSFLLFIISMFIPAYSLKTTGAFELELQSYSFFDLIVNGIDGNSPLFEFFLIVFGMLLCVISASLGHFGFKKQPKKPLVMLILRIALALLGMILGIIGTVIIIPYNMYNTYEAGPFVYMAALILSSAVGVFNSIIAYLISTGKFTLESLFKTRE